MATLISTPLVSQKFSVFLEGNGFGASESFYLLTADASAATVAVNAYLNIRKQMLFPDCQIQAVRIGFSQLSVTPGDGKDYVRVSDDFVGGFTGTWSNSNVKLNVPSTGTYVPAVPGATESPTDIALHERLTMKNGRKSTRYIVWPPSSVVKKDPSGANLALEPTWLGLLGQWQDLLTNAAANPPSDSLFALKCIVPPDSTNTFTPRTWGITGTTPAPIWFTALDSQVGAWQVGAKISVRGVLYKQIATRTGAFKLPSVNGHWYIDSIQKDVPGVGVDTITLRGTTGIDPSLFKLPGTVQLTQYQLSPIAKARAIRLRIHKRGKDWTVPRGRRLTRVSLDP